MKIACIQLGAGRDKAKNIDKAVRLVSRAARNNARLICLPEVFSYRGPLAGDGVRENIPGPSTKPLAELARKFKVHILAGSVCERIPNSKKIFNTSVLINEKGRVCAKYRKINLFKAQIDSKKLNEAEHLRRGKRVATAKLKGFQLGLTICYDLRFPELFREYARRGADVIFVPSSFTKKTGQAHWETLLRARAIENICYIVAPNQVGKDYRGVLTYGNSMIVGPWGQILKRASGTKEEIIYSEIHKKEITDTKRVLPGIRK